MSEEGQSVLNHSSHQWLPWHIIKTFVVRHDFVAAAGCGEGVQCLVCTCLINNQLMLYVAHFTRQSHANNNTLRTVYEY